MLQSTVLRRGAKSLQAGSLSFTRNLSSKPVWATIDVGEMGKSPTPYAVSNLVGGEWKKAKSEMLIPHPLDKNQHSIFSVPDTDISELEPYFTSMRKVPKSGVHNPLKNVSSLFRAQSVCISIPFGF
jgi:1-pyrroline-5-carboxylate dehydrogenase